MTAMQIVFLITAIITVLAALMVVTRRNLIHAALFLVLALFGVAVIFAMLEAGFVAVVQVLVYIGAIAILLIFAVMLTRKVVSGTNFSNTWWAAAVVALALVFALITVLSQWQGFFTSATPALPTGDTVARLGETLVSPDGYFIPFLVVAVLLTGALIGAIVVAFHSRKQTGG